MPISAISRLVPVLIALAVVVSSLTAAEPTRPNIIVIYCDDLGFGDVGCNGATAVETPHIDRLAEEGLRFTDGHSPSATCTPSRYAMLTGEYAWRKRGTGIAKGDAAAIIQPGRTTMASILRDAGYRTGVVGKWHLGLGDGNLDWNGRITPGPLQIGFDYCYLIPATGDRVPCVYVENESVVDLDPADPITVSFGKPLTELPTGAEHPELLTMHPSHGHNQTIINGISRIGYMSGGESAWWKDEDMADRITGKAVEFVEREAAVKGSPFFLYFSFHDIHVPRVPHPRFVGKTEMGPRGDAIAQLDWCVGELLATLDRLQLTEQALVIFSSDNGPVIDDGYKDQSVLRLGTHQPAGPWRGGKYSAFEGGTRVPFITRWPGRIKPGTSRALVSHVDFPAAFAALVAADVPSREIPDSVNILPALLGDSAEGRTELVEHANALALRQGDWKFIEAKAGPRALKTRESNWGRDPEPSCTTSPMIRASRRI
ncbi:MAG: arylsulfatase [Planctomycetaceae bacterium]